MSTLIANIAVVTATILAWTTLVPQIVKLAKGRDAEGVSATWPAIGLVSNAAWTAYLSSQELWLAAPSTAVMILFYALVLRYLALSGRDLRSSAGRGITWVVMLTSTGLLGGWPALGLLLGWSYVVQLAPSVWSAYRSYRPSGVSIGTWALIGVEAVLWGVYGWFYSDSAIVIYAVVGLVASTAIVLRVFVTRNRPVVATA